MKALADAEYALYILHDPIKRILTNQQNQGGE